MDNLMYIAGQCAYMGVGHMGFPVFYASHQYFLRKGWTILCVDLDVDKLEHIDCKIISKYKYLPENIDILFLGIRPQDVHSIEKKKTSPKVIISMIAGVTCKEINKIWPASNVVRIIPNTPCEFGSGITPVYFNGLSKSEYYYELILGALACLGEISIVGTEQMIDAATGISAGGPAYFMFFADVMIDVSLEMGFPPDKARELVAETMCGSGILLKRTKKSPKTLAKEVMTPNGTTERGIHKLRIEKTDSIIKQALKLASTRASEMAELSNR